MSAPKNQLVIGLATIWRRHQHLIEERVARIAEALRLLSINQLPADARQQAGEDAHKLAGNLGTFGHPTASDHARALELKLLSPDKLDLAEIDKFNRHTKELQIAIQEITAAMTTGGAP